MSDIKIGFVGVGSMGQCAHLRNYVTVAGCQVVALAEVREDLGKKVAARYGVPRRYRSHEEMLRNEELDGIIAPQQFGYHAALVPELLTAGVPVFTEKPLTISVEAGEKIVAAVQQSGTWHMLGYHKRSDPAVMYAKGEIERLRGTSELGRLRYVRILMPAGDWVAGGFTDLIRTDEPVPELVTEAAPGNMDEDVYREYVSFVNFFIHQVNLMRHLIGESYQVSYADPSGVLMAVVSDGGVPGTLEMSPYRTSLDWQESALVAFERGYIKIDLPAPLTCNRPGRVEVFRDPGEGETPETVIPQLPWVHAMKQQATNFVRAVKGEAKPPCEAEEALEDLRVARQYIRLLRD